MVLHDNYFINKITILIYQNEKNHVHLSNCSAINYKQHTVH